MHHKRTMFHALITALLLAGTTSAAADSCRKLYRLTDLNYAIEPGIEVAATDDVPAAHCRVNGVINRAIRFRVTMPENWNGRMMFSAVGGSAGVIGDTTSLLSRGFAMASTDTGHEAREANNFFEQPEALLDYAYRGVHLATAAAKTVVTTHYERDISHSYLHGCSNGGRAAMLEAARFPEDYDGIIAGAPAFQFKEMIAWMTHVSRAQEQHPLNKESLVLLDNASREACDDLDGVQDGVINDPRQCTREPFEVGELVCADGQSGGCLTPGQIETARTVYDAVTNADGEVISPGLPPGAEAAGDWAFWLFPLPENIAPPGFAGLSVVAGVGDMATMLMRFDPTFDLEQWDTTDRHRIADVTSPLDLRTADLSEFKARGGKLIIYQGWNDFPLRPGRATDYLAEVESHMGGAEPTSEFLRLFMVPGMLHCRGGPGAWQADYVEPIVSWTEEGAAPDRIVATQPGPVQMPHLVPAPEVEQTRRFSRPLCAYPKLAQYKGRGDDTEAANFECR